MRFILWPFEALARLITFVIELSGRLLAVFLGFAITIAGVALTLTFIGAIVGVPLIILGVMLMGRSLF